MHNSTSTGRDQIPCTYTKAHTRHRSTNWSKEDLH